MHREILFGGRRIASAVLLVDPASQLHHVELMGPESLAVVVLDVRIEQLVKLGQIVEGHRGVGMMLRVKIGLPEKPA